MTGAKRRAVADEALAVEGLARLARLAVEGGCGLELAGGGLDDRAVRAYTGTPRRSQVPTYIGVGVLGMGVRGGVRSVGAGGA
jgi:hypothetical protein